MIWWTRTTKSDISQLKPELANAQSGKLSMCRGLTGDIVKWAQQFNSLDEKQESGGKREKKQREKKEGKEKRKGGHGKEDKKREKRKRKAKMNRHMWKRFIYIQEQLQPVKTIGKKVDYKKTKNFI